MFIAVLACLLIIAGALGGCGGDDPAATAADGRLVVILDDGAGSVTETGVSCAEAPDLCAELRRVLAEPADRVCTQVSGGPERIMVRGTLDGTPVDLTVTRTDGCEIDRYDRITATLPETDG
jgi:hypothetical protein